MAAPWFHVHALGAHGVGQRDRGFWPLVLFFLQGPPISISFLLVVPALPSHVFRANFDDTLGWSHRQDESFRSLFEAAGFEIVRTELQKALPKGLFPVRMYALRPAPSPEA